MVSKMQTRRQIDLEVARVINQKLYDEGSVSRAVYETVNQSLLEKIRSEQLSPREIGGKSVL